jgi:hypothetical protein
VYPIDSTINRFKPTVDSTSTVPEATKTPSEQNQSMYTDFLPAPVLKFRSRKNKLHLFAQINTILHNSNNETTNNTIKPSYASIVKFHPPNDIPIESLNNNELYNDKYSKKASKKYSQSNNSKLSTKGRPRKKINIVFNNIDNDGPEH